MANCVENGTKKRREEESRMDKDLIAVHESGTKNLFSLKPRVNQHMGVLCSDSTMGSRRIRCNNCNNRQQEENE